MQLRKHQFEFMSIIDRIISGESIRKVIAHITPGGGKSLIALLAGELVKAGLVDSICWIVPRLTLAHQAELNAVDPYFAKMLDHHVSIRSATNEVNPCRGQTGYVTTFQALAVDDKEINAREFLQKRYVLIIDETHHAADDEKSLWAKALTPMVERAKYVFLLSGTLRRGDDKKIAFLPYIKEGDAYIPDLQNTDDIAVISYSRTDALMEKAILPIKFILSDGRVEWEDKDGRKQEQRLSRAIFDTGSAIFTALNTEFSNQLLRDGLNHWKTYKATYPRSKIMIVAANIDHGRKVLTKLSEWGYHAKMATSADTAEAVKTLNLFRNGKLEICVTVAMCAEGFDCKPLTHIVCLTNVRSTPYIEQLVARAVRVDPLAGPYNTQMAYVFAPDDFLFRQVVEQIRAEQLPMAHEAMTEGEGGGNGNGEKRPGINPLAGEITGTREVSLGDIPDGFIPDQVQTIKEQEEEVLHRIEMHVRKFSFDNRYKPQRISFEIKQQFGKSRRHMTLDELKSCLRWVRRTYPIEAQSPEFLPDGVSRTRGCRVRVPTKAQPWHLPLFGE